VKHLLKSWRLLFCLSVFSGISEKGMAAISDTVIIAESKQEFRIDRSHPEVVIPLQRTGKKSDDGAHILFEGLVLQKAPEGIYEVYLKDSIPGASGLRDTGPFFVHTLNTYYLSDHGSHNQLMNVGRQQTYIQQTKHKTGPYYLIIVFRGNKFANGKRSVDAGELTIRTVGLIGFSP
jgi:hypothetical protein